MRYTNVFCLRYGLTTGTKLIAWFYIVLYVVNIIINIAAVDIVTSYKENVDGNTDYNKTKLLVFHYTCFVFGVVTIGLSIAFLVKLSESEDFLKFMVKWNVIRSLFVVAAILYLAIDMSHILIVTVSSTILVIDLCASAYFTGVLSSYIKALQRQNGEIQIHTMQKRKEPSVYLVSHKSSLHTEKVSYVNEVGEPSQKEQVNSTDAEAGFVNIALDEDEVKSKTESDHNFTTDNDATNASGTEKYSPVSAAKTTKTESPDERNALSESKEKSDMNESTINKDDANIHTNEEIQEDEIKNGNEMTERENAGENGSDSPSTSADQDVEENERKENPTINET